MPVRNSRYPDDYFDHHTNLNLNKDKIMKLPSHIRSELTTKQLKELRRCIKIAFPEWSRQQHYIALACQPDAAYRFMSNDYFTAKTSTN